MIDDWLADETGYDDETWPLIGGALMSWTRRPACDLCGTDDNNRDIRGVDLDAERVVDADSSDKHMCRSCRERLARALANDC